MEQQQAEFLNNLTLFGMGFSWGGYESLAIPFHPHRTAVPWTNPAPCVRFHIGLENPQDLIDDLKQSFGRIKRGQP
jgi:cystathionine beta-lyase